MADLSDKVQRLEGISCQLKQLKDLFTALEAHTLDEVADKLDSTELAKLHVCLAYGIASLHYTKLNCCNAPAPLKVRVLDDLQRIKQYVTKLNKLEKDGEDKTDNVIAKKQRTAVVNKAAAKRMIVHEVGASL